MTSVDVVIPVLNEEKDLPRSVAVLWDFFNEHLPYQWQIVIADNGSTDKTLAVAQALETYPTQISMFYLMSNHLGEIGKLLPNLERVGEGEVDKLIFESTVLPFFQRYPPERRS